MVLAIDTPDPAAYPPRIGRERGIDAAEEAKMEIFG